ncbi:MAG: AAA family ATPase [Fimbriimonadales bacterium]|nr:AAA family ATPase [Fimbriimonadales bacterium]
MLFYGGPSTGKTTLAKWLAQAWLCSSKDPPCGQCPACRSFRGGGNPDFLELAPQGASALIRLSAICPTPGGDESHPTALRDFFRLSPLVSKTKVALLENADRMTPDAANALLKILEEPQPSQRLILTTREIGWVLPTVVSRCVGIACPARAPGGDPSELLFGPFSQPERRAGQPELFEEVFRWVQGLPHRGVTEALLVSDELQLLAERLQKAERLSARQARAEVLKLVAEGCRRLRPTDFDALEAIAEAHRRILANGNAGMVLDALATRLLSARRRMHPPDGNPG